MTGRVDRRVHDNLIIPSRAAAWPNAVFVLSDEAIIAGRGLVRLSIMELTERRVRGVVDRGHCVARQVDHGSTSLGRSASGPGDLCDTGCAVEWGLPATCSDTAPTVRLEGRYPTSRRGTTVTKGRSCRRDDEPAPLGR